MAEPLLVVEDLHASVGSKEILRGVDLAVRAGEVHAIMGPNGSGKSTLAQVLAGHATYQVTGGRVTFCGDDLLAMPPEGRARRGLFMAFQYPVEIPGLSIVEFLRAALNAGRRERGEEPIELDGFLPLVRAKMRETGLDETLLRRSVNDGFSGGEKKRNEIFQMALLEPRLCILDETDSGLDIDALRTVARGVNAMRSPERGMVVVTHYQRLLDHIVPDIVHVLIDGRIVRTGDANLARELESRGYVWLDQEATPAEAMGA